MLWTAVHRHTSAMDVHAGYTVSNCEAHESVHGPDRHGLERIVGRFRRIADLARPATGSAGRE
jgi:hypothetical protein